MEEIPNPSKVKQSNQVTNSSSTNAKPYIHTQYKQTEKKTENTKYNKHLLHYITKKPKPTPSLVIVSMQQQGGRLYIHTYVQGIYKRPSSE